MSGRQMLRDAFARWVLKVPPRKTLAEIEAEVRAKHDEIWARFATAPGDHWPTDPAVTSEPAKTGERG